MSLGHPAALWVASGLEPGFPNSCFSQPSLPSSHGHRLLHSQTHPNAGLTRDRSRCHRKEPAHTTETHAGTETPLPHSHSHRGTPGLHTHLYRQGAWLSGPPAALPACQAHKDTRTCTHTLSCSHRLLHPDTRQWTCGRCHPCTCNRTAQETDTGEDRRTAQADMRKGRLSHACPTTDTALGWGPKQS